MMTSLNPSLMTGTGTVDCGPGLWPEGSLVIVSPLKSCGNDAFVYLHPLQWIETYKRENKGTKELQIRSYLWCGGSLFSQSVFHRSPERFIPSLAKFRKRKTGILPETISGCVNL